MCGITSTSRMQLNSMLGAMGLSENQLRKEKLTTSATFLLLRLVRNLKGSQVTLFLIWIIALECFVDIFVVVDATIIILNFSGDQIVRGNGAKHKDVPTKRFH